jgi:FHA domain
LTGKLALEVLVFGRTGFLGSFVFTTPKVSVGRSSGAQVHLDDPLVSLKHAELQMEGGLFRIRDLGSRTGTRVNGAPVLPRQPLEPTDEISIGPFRLRVTTCEPDAEEPEQEEGTMRLASMVSQVTSPPTEQAFYPPPRAEARSVENGKKSRERAPAPPWADEEALPPPVKRHARQELPEDPPADSNGLDPDSLGDLEATAVIRGAPSTRPPPPIAPAFAPPPKPIAAPAPPARAASKKTAPVATEEAVPSARSRPVPAQFDMPVPPRKASAQAAAVQTDTAQEWVPLAFGSPAERSEDEDDDEDEDDADFVPQFDLLEAMSRGGVTDDPLKAGTSLSLEVIQYRGDRIVSVRHPRAKGPVRRSGSKDAIGAVDRDGTFSLFPEACGTLTIRQGGRVLTTAELLATKDGTKQRLIAGMQARVDLGDDDGFLIQWVPRATDVPVPPMSLKPTRDGMTTGGLSIAVHLAVALFIAFVVIGDKDPADSDINAGRFATISQKELELEPPPPPPPPDTAAPVADVAPTMEIPSKHDPRMKIPVTKGAHNSAPSAQSAQTAQSTASTNKILSALGGAPSAASAISVTNLDALPAGAGDFKVSGAVGKAPGDSLRVAAAGASGGDVTTKSASEVGANNMGKVQAQTSGGVVRARVTSAAPASRGEGHLDRGEIQKVVNAHLYQVQGCYERQLAKDPSLGGKISYEWDVGATGGVSNVRVGRSTVHSTEVTTCIQSAIQGWKFPAPQGGSVTVTYPFAFSSLGG